MKILTNKEYEELLSGNKDASEKEILKAKISDLEKKHQKQLNDLEDDNDIKIRRANSAIDVQVSELTKKSREELAKVVAERDNYKKECEILNKAFQNLGFDVKDMKEILNKLVDGIVSKNTVQLIK